jgi:16S rRNA (guanine527-N7)-methyltransferase
MLTSDLSLLHDGINKLHLKLSSKQINSIEQYTSDIFTYNQKVNIIGAKNYTDIIIKHILDCLAGITYFSPFKNIADIGSGAGLPGILLAICFSEKHISLIESKSRKTLFLNKEIASLKLSNVSVMQQNVYEIKKKYNCITTRAFSNIQKILTCSENMITTDTQYILYKGTRSRIIEECTEAKLFKKKYDIIEIIVPFLKGERHLVKITDCIKHGKSRSSSQSKRRSRQNNNNH